MPSNMPPAIVFHATGDQTVPYANSVTFRDKMIENGSRCELVTFQGLGHSCFAKSKFGETGVAADRQTYEEVGNFLLSLGLMGEGVSAPRD